MKINTIVLLALLLSGCSAGPNKVTYPLRANELRIGGNVSVLYNIDEDGRASNIRILSAEPKNYFERSIKQDVSEWHFANNNQRNNVRLDVEYRVE